jgi:hypothetical protein
MSVLIGEIAWKELIEELKCLFDVLISYIQLVVNSENPARDMKKKVTNPYLQHHAPVEIIKKPVRKRKGK